MNIWLLSLTSRNKNQLSPNIWVMEAHNKKKSQNNSNWISRLAMKSIYQVTILIDSRHISVYLCETRFCGHFQFSSIQKYHIHLVILATDRAKNTLNVTKWKKNPKNKTEFVYLFKVIRNMQNSMLLLINVQQIEAQTIKRTRAHTKSSRNENKYFAKKLDKTETRQKKNTACTYSTY